MKLYLDCLDKQWYFSQGQHSKAALCLMMLYPHAIDDVTQDMDIRDEMPRQEAFFSCSGLISQTLSDNTEKERHVEIRKHIVYYQAQLYINTFCKYESFTRKKHVIIGPKF